MRVDRAGLDGLFQRRAPQVEAESGELAGLFRQRSSVPGVDDELHALRLDLDRRSASAAGAPPPRYCRRHCRARRGSAHSPASAPARRMNSCDEAIGILDVEGADVDVPVRPAADVHRAGAKGRVPRHLDGDLGSAGRVVHRARRGAAPNAGDLVADVGALSIAQRTAVRRSAGAPRARRRPPCRGRARRKAKIAHARRLRLRSGRRRGRRRGVRRLQPRSNRIALDRAVLSRPRSSEKCGRA